MSQDCCELATQAIRSHQLTSRLSLEITNQEDGLLLQGVVSSYYQKQMAQEIVRRIQGVARIRNELQVATT